MIQIRENVSSNYCVLFNEMNKSLIWKFYHWYYYPGVFNLHFFWEQESTWCSFCLSFWIFSWVFPKSCLSFFQIAWVSWENQLFHANIGGKMLFFWALRAVFVKLWVKHTQKMPFTSLKMLRFFWKKLSRA